MRGCGSNWCWFRILLWGNECLSEAICNVSRDIVLASLQSSCSKMLRLLQTLVKRGHTAMQFKPCQTFVINPLLAKSPQRNCLRVDLLLTSSFVGSVFNFFCIYPPFIDYEAPSPNCTVDHLFGKYLEWILLWVHPNATGRNSTSNCSSHSLRCWVARVKHRVFRGLVTGKAGSSSRRFRRSAWMYLYNIKYIQAMRMGWRWMRV